MNVYEIRKEFKIMIFVSFFFFFFSSDLLTKKTRANGDAMNFSRVSKCDIQKICFFLYKQFLSIELSYPKIKIYEHSST